MPSYLTPTTDAAESGLEETYDDGGGQLDPFADGFNEQLGEHVQAV